MVKVNRENIHRVVLSATFKLEDLQAILGQYVADQAGIKLDWAGVTVGVSYLTGSEVVRVDVSHDLTSPDRLPPADYLNTLAGAHLDAWGTAYGVHRNIGEYDTFYRNRILQEINKLSPR